jgi:hypothetical protein
MTRWLAPLGGAVFLLVLLVGLVRAETDTATTAGVSLVFWGMTGLALVAVAVGAVELTAARRAPGGRPPAVRRPPAARRPAAPSPAAAGRPGPPRLS